MHTQSAAPPRGSDAQEALKGCTVVLQLATQQGISGLATWMRLCQEHGASCLIVVGEAYARPRLPAEAKGWQWQRERVLETELGDPHCRRLALEVWAPKAKGLCSLEELGLRSPVGPPCRSI